MSNLQAELKIAVIGYGNLGKALAQGLQEKTPCQIGVWNRSKARLANLPANLKVYENLADLCKECNYLLIAVKPWAVEEIITACLPYLGHSHCLISLAAGIDLHSLRMYSQQNCSVVRCMPTITARIYEGIFGLCLEDPDLLPEMREIVLEIFAQLGICIELEDAKFPAFSALAGAGPAYVFEFISAFMQAGVTLGFSWELSKKIALAVFKGSSSMAEQSEQTLESLRNAVCSPSGLTIAGLNKLHEKAVPAGIVQTILAANQHAIEMEKKNS